MRVMILVDVEDDVLPKCTEHPNDPLSCFADLAQYVLEKYKGITIFTVGEVAAVSIANNNQEMMAAMRLGKGLGKNDVLPS